MGKFVIRNVASGIKFDLKATNGQVIATSEVYTTAAACRNGIESVMKNAPVANVEDQTVENFETATHPKFEMYEDKGGEFRFRLTCGGMDQQWPAAGAEALDAADLGIA